MRLAIGTDAFIGREREMTELIAALDSAVGGQGRITMLVGEPGIGKTRLVEELETVALERGLHLAKAACYEGGSSPPYWPWTQAIRSILIEPSELILTALATRAAVIAEIVPEIGESIPDLGLPPELEPEQARFRLFDSVASFFGEVVSSEPMIIVLDDLHWADRSSLDLLEFIARDIGSSKLLLVGMYRGMELSRQHPFSETLATLARSREFRRIHLRGLERDEVGRLVETVSKTEAPTSWISEIYDRTEGNPFFVVEVTRDLTQSEAFNAGEFDSVGPFRIPDGVREAIGLRLNRLSEECNQLLHIAAVAGKEFELDLIKMLHPDRSDAQFLSALEEALSAGIVEEMNGTPRRCRFAHALFQETLLQEFSFARRAGIHREIGEALEKLYPEDLEAHADELSYHISESGSATGNLKQIRYSLMAGERALSAYAWDVALIHFQRGLDATKGQVIDTDKAALLFGLARALASTLGRHRLHEAVTTARPAFDYFVSEGDVESALAIAEYPFISMHEEGGMTRLLADAIQLVPPDSYHAGRLLGRYGLALIMELGEIESASEVLDRALTIARRDKDTALEMTVLNKMANAHMMNFNPEMSLEHSLGAIGLGLNIDHLSESHWWAASALITLGNLREARLHATAQLDLTKTLGIRFNIIQVFFSSEVIEQLQGNWESARGFIDKGLAIDQRDVRLVSNRAMLEYEVGNFDQGSFYLEQLVETMNLAPPSPSLEYSIVIAAIGISTRISRDTSQVTLVEPAANIILSSTPPPSEVLIRLARYGLAMIAVVRGDVEMAREQYDVLKTRQMTISVLNLVCGHRVLGLLAQTLGWIDRACAHFGDSLIFCQKADARPELAWTSYDYATVLLQRDESGDRIRAELLISEAIAISTELDMRPLLDRSIDLRDSTLLDSARSVGYPAGLTPREVEVLRLLASGMSNADIAGELVLSVRTVERHISNVYGKTGSAGRANATAFAFTNGLMHARAVTE